MALEIDEETGRFRKLRDPKMLHEAIWANRCDAVIPLLACSASIEARNMRGRNAEDIAELLWNHEMIRLIDGGSMRNLEGMSAFSGSLFLKRQLKLPSTVLMARLDDSVPKRSFALQALAQRLFPSAQKAHFPYSSLPLAICGVEGLFITAQS